MRRENEIYNGLELKQVNKTVARKLFNKGVTVYILPSNMRLNNTWGKPLDINQEMYDMTVDNFDKIVNSFEYYNCSNETGLYSHFLIENKEA